MSEAGDLIKWWIGGYNARLICIPSRGRTEYSKLLYAADSGRVGCLWREYNFPDYLSTYLFDSLAQVPTFYSDQSQQAQTMPWANQNSMQMHVTDFKRGKTHASKSWLGLVSLLIGSESGASATSSPGSLGLAIQEGGSAILDRQSQRP